jgi:hypothetical protein
MIDVFRAIVAIVVVTVTCLTSQATAQGQSGHEHGQAPHEGAISITGNDVNEKMTVIGGSVGHQTLNDIEVGLFVLQAESPDRLAPGAKGPTHLFNLTFLDASESGRIDGVAGSLMIEGPDGESWKAPFKPFDSYYQATTRLEQEGQYKLSVQFEAEGHDGQTQQFPFEYRRKKHQGHQH